MAALKVMSTPSLVSSPEVPYVARIPKTVSPSTNAVSLRLLNVR